jgi:hypothetical protein
MFEKSWFVDLGAALKVAGREQLRIDSLPHLGR